ncbi:MAG: hypothetical protein INR64_17770 [Caulobacteraceae bacterium]|nr:hypothetical protein [Caulobacter sp.]
MQLRRLCFGMITVALLAPQTVSAASLTYADIFAGSAPTQKLLLIGLALSTLACVGILTRKMLAQELTGGSPFISGMRFAGPIAGVFGCAYAALRMSVGIAAVSAPLSAKLLAPAFAEMATMIAAGFCTGVIAVASQWLIESRIERELLAA